MRSTFIQPDTIVSLTIMRIAEEELSRDENGVVTPLYIQIYAFLVNQIRERSQIGKEGRGHLERTLSLRKQTLHLSEHLFKEIAEVIDKRLRKITNMTEMYSFLIDCIKQLRDVKLANIERTSFSIVEAFVRRCDLELKKMDFQNLIDLYSQFVLYVNHNIGKSLGNNANERIPPESAEAVAIAAKSHLENQGPQYKNNFAVMPPIFNKSSILLSPTFYRYNSYFKALMQSVEGNYYEATYNFHRHFDKNMKDLSDSSVQPSISAEQAAPLTKILLHLKSLKLEAALNNINETIRRAQYNNENEVIPYCLFYKSKVFEMLGASSQQTPIIETFLGKSLEIQSPEIQFYSCLQHFWMMYNYGKETVEDPLLRQHRLNTTVILSDAVSKIFDGFAPKKDLHATLLTKRSQFAIYLGMKKISDLLLYTRNVILGKNAAQWDKININFDIFDSILDNSGSMLIQNLKQLEIGAPTNSCSYHFLQLYFTAKILLRKNCFASVDTILTELESIAHTYPDPYIYIRLMFLKASFFEKTKNYSRATMVLSKIKSLLQKRGLIGRLTLICEYKEAEILTRIDKSRKTYVSIKEGLSKAKKTGMNEIEVQFNLLLVQYLIDNTYLSKASTILNKLARRVINRSTSIKLKFYYLKCVLSFAILKKAAASFSAESLLIQLQESAKLGLSAAQQLESATDISTFLMFLVLAAEQLRETESRNKLSSKYLEFGELISKSARIVEGSLVASDLTPPFKLLEKLSQMYRVDLTN